MMTVHGMRASGNCYKVQLAMDQLGMDYRWVEYDITRGQTHTAEFLDLNANGKVPALELDDGRCLAESNAILCYLAEGSPLLSGERWQRALTLQWMFFEQYTHEPCIAVARFICRWLPGDHPRRAELPALRQRAKQALAVMDRHLSDHDFFSGDRYGIADIALFAYTHCAPDGGVDLSPYACVEAWLERVRAQPGFKPMQG